MIYQVKTYGDMEDISLLKDPALLKRLFDHITDNLEQTGLHEYMDKGYSSIVTKMEITELNADGTALWDIMVSKVLSEDEKEYILDFIMGQCSDGWGEGYEQYPFFEKGSVELYYSPWKRGTKPEFC